MYFADAVYLGTSADSRRFEGVFEDFVFAI
jgi:hypothetical protein